MKLDIRGEEDSLAEPDGSPSGNEGPVDGQHPDRKSAARSAENIARWRTYLPDDCIDTMIGMGWDRST